MFVKVIKRYRDTQLEAELPVGVILEVNADRGAALLNAGVVEVYNFCNKTSETKNIKSEETKVVVKEEDIVKIEEIDPSEIPEGATVVDEVEIVSDKSEEAEKTVETIETKEDKWAEPKTTKAAGK